MQTLIYKPHKLLRPFIEAYAITHQIEPNKSGQFFPSNLPVLCFDLNKKHYKESNSSTNFNFPLGIVGTLNRFFHLDSIPEKSVQIIFKPYGAFQFLKTPMHSFVNNGTDLESVIPNLKNYIHKLEDCDNNHYNSIAILEEFLLEKLKSQSQKYLYFDRLEYACQEIKKNRNQVGIGDICYKTNMSETRFRIHFKEKIGVSPKQFSQIEKFQQIHTYYQFNPQTDWMDLVTRFSFFDQTHFIKGFKRFFGCTPSEFQKRQTDSIPQNVFDLIHQ